MRLIGTLVLLLVIGTVGLAGERAVKVIVADAVVDLFDRQAKDVFVFVGALPVRQSVVLGVQADGSEYRLAPVTLPTPAPAPAPVGEKGPVPRPDLPSLIVSCLDCHGKGKARGGFTLFDPDGRIAAGVNWKEVLGRIDAAEMPPPASGYPAVSAADLTVIRVLARH